MRKYLFLVMVLSVFMLLKNETLAAENLKNSNDNMYQSIYQECTEMNYETVDDDYSAYAYLLENMEDAYIDSNYLQIQSEIYKGLNREEIEVLDDFVSRVNNLIQLGAVVIDSNLKISQAEAPTAETQIMPRIATYNLMPIARAHATELRRVYDNAVFGTATMTAGIYFAERVKSGGIWDYKGPLGWRTYYTIPELNVTMNGETIGNFHYGYVGSSCFGATTLKSFAGLAQIVSGTSDMSYYDSYFDDPADQEDIQWGINIYNAEH